MFVEPRGRRLQFRCAKALVVASLIILSVVNPAFADKRDPISAPGWPAFTSITKWPYYPYDCAGPVLRRNGLTLVENVPINMSPYHPPEGAINNCFDQLGQHVSSLWIAHAACPTGYTTEISLGGPADDICVPNTCGPGQTRDSEADCVCSPGLAFWNGACKPLKDSGPTCNRGIDMGGGTNPIHIGTGNKYQSETDYAGEPEFSRSYNSIAEDATGPLGPHWLGSYSGSLATAYSDGSAQANRPSGKRIGFTYYSSIDAMRPSQDVADSLVKLPSNAGWRYAVASDGSSEIYNGVGQLQSIVWPSGRSRTLTYDGSGRLATVADGFGRTLNFGYDSQNRVATLTQPDGLYITYGYDVAGNLSTVSYPDGHSRQYLYENAAFAHALTGLVDENLSRYATWQYDGNGLAYSSEHAGGVDRSIIVFNGNTSAVTDSLGTSRTYTLSTALNTVRLMGVSQPAGSGCAPAAKSYVYDSSGYPSYRTDFNGNVIGSEKNNQFLETKRTEWDANRIARMTTRTWHPDFPLESRRAEPKKLTTWVYNGQVDPVGGGTVSCAPSDALLPDGKPIAVLCKKTEQATTDATGASGFSATVTGAARSWTYTYNRYGQVLTAKGPRSDVNDTTTYTYYADTTGDHTLGDLESVTDPLGHLTRYTRYDPNGRLLEGVDANGLVTTLAYTPRGWLKTRQVGSELTTYDYDAVGQLKKVTASDGSWIGYDYDDAHRLTTIYDNRGDRISYTLDNAGNRTREDVSDPSGNLVRTQSRVYDALSRLQNSIQPE